MLLLIISGEKKIATLLSSLKNFGKPPLPLSKKLEIPPPKKNPQSLTLF